MSTESTPSNKSIASLFSHLSYSRSPVASPGGPRQASAAPPTRAPRIGSDVDSDDIDNDQDEDGLEVPLSAETAADERSACSPSSHESDVESERLAPESSTSVLLEVQPRSGASLDGTISHHFAVSPLKRSAPSASRAGSSLPEKRARPSEPVVTPPRKKKAQPARPFAHPSTYAHLSPLTDHITLNNDVLLVGINPGVSSALHGHAYAGSTNRFWKILHASGFTPTVLPYSEDSTLPSRFNLGLTNLVSRPTKSASELSKTADLRGSVGDLVEKIVRWKPRVVCFVGKEIWQAVEFVFASAEGAGKKRRAGSQSKVKVDWIGPRPWVLLHEGEEGTVRETLFFAVSSTSGLVRDSFEERLHQWTTLKGFVDLIEKREDPGFLLNDVAFWACSGFAKPTRVVQVERVVELAEGIRSQGKREVSPEL